MSRINSHLTFYALAHMHKPCEAIGSVSSITRRLGFDTVRIPVESSINAVVEKVRLEITIPKCPLEGLVSSLGLTDKDLEVFLRIAYPVGLVTCELAAVDLVDLYGRT